MPALQVGPQNLLGDSGRQERPTRDQLPLEHATTAQAEIDPALAVPTVSSSG